MRGKIILEEHICMPEDDPENTLKSMCSDAPKLAEVLLDLHHFRLQEMDANGVEFAIMSQNSPGPQGMADPQEAAAYAVRANDYLAVLVAKAPDRFAAFASLSMHSASNAAQELTRCVQQFGMVGAMLHDGQEYLTKDGQLAEYLYDDERYDPFWAAVQELEVPVYLHPKRPIPTEFTRLYQERPWLLGPTFSFARDLSFHVIAICTGGVFDRFPRAKMIVGHMGENILGQLNRTDHWLEKRDRKRKLATRMTQREYFERNVLITTAGYFSTNMLTFAMAEIGTDRILFSADSPFENITEASEWLDTLPISNRDVAKVGRLNALALFPSIAKRMKSAENEKRQQNRERRLFTTNAGFE